MVLRKHQASIDAIIRKVSDGKDRCTDILANVCPGGGKSALPIIAGRLISSGIVDKICWVVPRLTLQYQAESNFVDPFFRSMLRHNLTIRSSTNDNDPCRNLNGFATTYQAIGVNNSIAADEFKRKRYALVLDEFHHLDNGGVWYESIKPLVELASFRLLMTGTLTRGDKKEIGFLKYRTVGEDDSCEIRQADTDESETFRCVNYSRSDALSERAIIPVKFFLHDAATSWKTKGGQEHEYRSFAAARQHSSEAIYTAINTEFADELIERGTRHWLDYRTFHRSSQMLIVAANIELAKRAMEYLRGRGVVAEVATSADSDAARTSINNLKKGKINCLVGVAMFYEGFDRKQISHIVSLTHIRSTPWIEQMVARAVRVDPAIPYDQQYAYVFAPADPEFRAIVSLIESEQQEFVRKRKGDSSADGEQLDLFESGTIKVEQRGPVIPIGSSLSGHQERTVGYHHQYELPIEPTPLTPSEREGKLRRDIEEHVRRFAANTGRKPIEINRTLKDVFGKAREDMVLSELEATREHLLIHYPLNTFRRPAIRRTATAM